MQDKRPLMGTDNILELQDNGYKSTVSAISEIIDNSIQANAKNVQIILVRNTTRSVNEIDELLIVDDGDGMDESTFSKALQMSAGTRSKAKSGLGKYGQGLPNSSISQTKRVEVYTYQKNSLLFNHIDLDEIYESGQAYLPDTEIRKSIDFPLFNSGKLKINETGTIVRWVKPNKLKPKTVNGLVSNIVQFIGRTFRNFIVGYTDKDGTILKTKISIVIFEYNGVNYEQNGFQSIEEIEPFDPMFLMPKTQMNKLLPESQHPTSVLLKEEIKQSFKVEYNNEVIETEVILRLSYCKKEERERYGRNAGNELIGKKYLFRNLTGTSGYHNISVIRAGREIDHGSFGFITNVSDQRQRWWSAEIIVEPIIDSIIGIDNKKQQAANIQFLDTKDEDYDSNHDILKWISIFLSKNIEMVVSIISSQNANSTINATENGNKISLPPGGATEAGEPVISSIDVDNEEGKVIKLELFNWLQEKYQDLKKSELDNIVNYAFSMKDNHLFVKSDLGDTQLFSYKIYGTKVLIELNYKHSFYNQFMQTFELDSNQDKAIRSIRLLISAMVNSEIVNTTQDRMIIADRKKIRNRMFESLDEYIEELYSN